jgi:glycolate oxidase iron-sulfur subunit
VSAPESVHVPLHSLFDSHHPPDPALIGECVHCGFCLPACPTYMLWREEMDSPRGRIYLMKMAAEGKIDAMDESFVQHFDRCLGCMSCMTACPSGVEYDKLIEATRAQIERNHRRPFFERLYRRMIFEVFPHPSRLRWMAAPLWLYQVSGLRELVRRTGVLKSLPARLQQMEALLPDISFQSLRANYPARVEAVGAPRKKVGFVLGCVQRVFFDRINAATVRVLAAEGYELYIPPRQGCCGALAAHTGREPEALASARQLIDSFEGLDLDYIVTNAAGCGSNLKDYGHLLRDDPKYSERARRFSEKCRDVSEVLAESAPRAQRHPLNLRVAYQDSCHLLHAQRIGRQPRELLRAIPSLQIVELPESHVCCGSAGVYNLMEPVTAHELGHRKAEHVARTKADMLVSANPGCLLQLTNELLQMGVNMPTCHPIQLIDASIHGTQAPKTN